MPYRQWIRISLSLILLLKLTLAPAADFQNAVQVYERGDFPAAYREFYELAQQGHVDAQNNLGVLYHTGRGTARDYLAAARWFRRAARHGHGDAQSNLAALYMNGYGVPQDHLLAYAWFHQAALQGVQGAREQRDRIAAQLTSEQIMLAAQLVMIDAPAKPATDNRLNGSSHGYYGPVTVGETLWSIASKVKPAGVATRAMVNALMRANPEAFAGPAADSLKIEARLRIPPAGEITRFSAAPSVR